MPPTLLSTGSTLATTSVPQGELWLGCSFCLSPRPAFQALQEGAELCSAADACALMQHLWQAVLTPSAGLSAARIFLTPSCFIPFLHSPNALSTCSLPPLCRWTGYVLNMTSGTWLSPADSSAYIWTHQVLVIVPDNLNPNFTKNAALYITGGSQDQAYTDITPDNEDVFS